MSTAISEPDRYFTRDDYRRWCEEQPSGRYERLDGRVLAMAPERAGHVRVKLNVALALRRAIAMAGASCEAFGDGLTVEAGDSDFQPDALVHCGASLGGTDTAATNPVIVVEILSPGTRSVDTGRKLAGYFSVASIAHYLVIDPLQPLVIHHRRTSDSIETRIVRDGSIELLPPGITLAVADCYGSSLGVT